MQFSSNVPKEMKNQAPIRQQSARASATPPKAEELLALRNVSMIAAALAAVVFAIDSPSRHFQFIPDGHRFTGHPRLHSSGHRWEYLTGFVRAQIPGGPLSFSGPLFLLWLRLNFVLRGDSSWGWHLLRIRKHLSVAFPLGLIVAYRLWRCLACCAHGQGNGCRAASRAFYLGLQDSIK